MEANATKVESTHKIGILKSTLSGIVKDKKRILGAVGLFLQGLVFKSLVEKRATIDAWWLEVNEDEELVMRDVLPVLWK